MDAKLPRKRSISTHTKYKRARSERSTPFACPFHSGCRKTAFSLAWQRQRRGHHDRNRHFYGQFLTLRNKEK